MKRIKLLIAALLLGASSLTSCSSAADIGVTKLETPCDFMNALGDITKEAIELKESVGDGEPTESDKKQLQELSQKINEINKAVRSAEISDKDLMACEGAQEIMSTLSQIR